MTRIWQSRLAVLACSATLAVVAAIQDPQPDDEKTIDPLARIRYRLTIKDWVGAKQLADSLLQSEMPLSLSQAALVDLARFRGAMSTGECESAVVPWLNLHANPLAREIPETLTPASLLPATSGSWGLAPGLLPLFFDRDRAGHEFQQLIEDLGAADRHQGESWRIYAAGLAIAAGRANEIAERGLLRIESAGEIDADLEGWRLLFQAVVAGADGNTQTAEESLAAALTAGEPSPAFRAMVDYCQAVVAETADTEVRMDSLLRWLQVAARHRHEFPQIASAALYRAATIARDLKLPSEARRIEDELVFSFPNSFHGRMIRAARDSR